jgi:hypothetical protein
MAPPRPPDPPESSEARRPEELAFSALSNTLSNDQFLSLHGLQIQDFFFDPADYDFDLTIDVEPFDPQVHFLPPALDPAPTTPSKILPVPLAAPSPQSDYAARFAAYWSTAPAGPRSTADSHSHAVPEPNAALLLSLSPKLELAPVAVVSPRHDHDHSSSSRPLSASFSAADSHSLAVSEPNAALLLSLSPKLELAPVAVVSPHLDLDLSSQCRLLFASSTAADSHSRAVPEPNAALLYSSLTNLELAPVAVGSPHLDLDVSSQCRPVSASFSVADSHSRPVLF